MMNIRHYLELPLSVISKLITLLIEGVYVKGFIPFTRIRGLKNNNVNVTCFRHGKIDIEGKNNSIEIKGNLDRCNIHIHGDNNHLYIGKETGIGRTDFWIRSSGGDITIGERTHIISAELVCQGTNNWIHIGNDCLFSSNVDIWNSDTHVIYDENKIIINPSKPILIKDHVWLGKRVSVLKGVTIEENSIAGFGTIITKDIPSSCIVVGQEQKIIKEGVNWDLKWHMNSINVENK